MALRVLTDCDNCGNRLGFERVGRQDGALMATCGYCGVTWLLDNGVLDPVEARLISPAG